MEDFLESFEENGISGPTAPRNTRQKKTGVSYASRVTGEVDLKDVKLCTNSEFAFYLEREMKARGIPVPEKKNGDPDIQKSKSAFKQWLLENDKETVKQDRGKSFKPRYPELWTELLLVDPPPVNEASDAEFDDDDEE